MRRHITKGQTIFRAGLWAFAGLFCIYLIGPILVFIPLSFNNVALYHYPILHFSLKWYQELLGSAEWSRALLNSLFVGSAATAIATALGTCAAIGLSNTRFVGKSVIMVILMTPMIVPTIVSAVGMYFAFARVGLDNSYLGLILAHAALGTPMVVVTVSAALARFDKNLLRAAGSFGANPIVAFRRINLPLILPGIASGAIFAFAISFDDVVAALFLAGPAQRTITPLQMYTRAGDLFDLTIVAASTVMLAIAIGMMIALRSPKRRERLSGGLVVGSRVNG